LRNAVDEADINFVAMLGSADGACRAKLGHSDKLAFWCCGWRNATRMFTRKIARRALIDKSYAMLVA
jgi:hypothetical protein